MKMARITAEAGCLAGKCGIPEAEALQNAIVEVLAPFVEQYVLPDPFKSRAM